MYKKNYEDKLKEIGNPDQASRIALYLEAYNSNAITSEQFVNIVYPDAENKESIIANLEELKKVEASPITPEMLGA